MKKFFQRSTNKTQNKPVQVQPNENIGDARKSGEFLNPAFSVEFAQSSGLQREHNEDALYVLISNLIIQDSSRSFGFVAIADGMGGHLHGELASKLAVSSMAAAIIEKILLPSVNPANASPPNSLQNAIREAILKAHQEVLQYATGGGTTLSACLFFGNYLTIAHVGDSRIYHIGCNGEVKLYTRDHSLVKRLVELGQISEKEAINHPQRNVLYRALGQVEPLEPDILTFPLPQSGYLLLCTDGLWGVVPDKDIARIILNADNLNHACNALVASANQAGGPDNISVILVKFNG